MKIVKQSLKKSMHLLLYIQLITGFAAYSQNGAAINTTGTPSDPSAMLDVSSTNSGILIPRLTKLQRSGISQPAEGLMIYQTDDTTGFWYYNGTSWKQLGSAAGSAISAGTLAGNTLYWNGTNWVESSNIYNAGGSVGIGTNNPEPTAKVEINSNNSGFLIPRMTTVERNAIVNPAQGLQIYNLDCDNFEYFNGVSWVIINPIIAGISISANPAGAICEGTSVTFTATPVNGGTVPVYQWKLNGVNVGTNSSTYVNSSLNNGDQISCELLSNVNCVSVNPAISNILTMIVSQPTTIANAGIDQNIFDTTSVILSANTPIAGNGTWSVVSGTAVIIDSCSPNASVFGLSKPYTTILRWTIFNHPCSYSYDDVIITSHISCGFMNDTRDGNTYNTIQIGNQCWMRENLKYLPSVVGSGTGSTTLPQYYVYGYDGTDVNIAKLYATYSNYGVLYNWAAAMNGELSSISNPSGVQGICPAGWHLPSDAECKQLEMHLGMSQVEADATGWRGTDEGDKLKEFGTSQWVLGNNGTNISGFTGIPGGYRNTNGSFSYLGFDCVFWTSTENGSNVWRRYLRFDNSKIYRTSINKGYGFSIRCVQD